MFNLTYICFQEKLKCLSTMHTINNCSNSLSSVFSTIKSMFVFVLCNAGIHFTGEAQVIDSAYQMNSSSIFLWGREKKEVVAPEPELGPITCSCITHWDCAPPSITKEL